jgi:hypothetical protein
MQLAGLVDPAVEAAKLAKRSEKVSKDADTLRKRIATPCCSSPASAVA